MGQGDAVLVDFFQESARVALRHLSPLETRQRIRQSAGDLGTGERHVEQATLLFQFSPALHGHLRGEQLFLQSHDVHVLELEAFRRVHRHEVDLVVVFVVVVRVGEEGDINEEVGQALGFLVERILHEALQGIEQFLHILIARHAFGVLSEYKA